MPGLIKEQWDQPWKRRHVVYRDTLARDLPTAGFTFVNDCFESPIGPDGHLYVGVNTSVNGNNDVSGAWFVADRSVGTILRDASETLGAVVRQHVLASGRLTPDDETQYAWSVGSTSANAPSVAHEVADAIVEFRNSMEQYGTRDALADRLEQLMAEQSPRIPFGAWPYTGPVFFTLVDRPEVANSVVAERRRQLTAAGRATALTQYDTFVEWFDEFAALGATRSSLRSTESSLDGPTTAEGRVAGI